MINPDLSSGIQGIVAQLAYGDSIRKAQAVRAPRKIDGSMDAIVQFLGEAVRSDDTFHSFLEKRGIDPHKGEAMVYAFVHSCLNPKKGMPRNVNPRELAMGEKVELEHTDNPLMARKIAFDHLAEMPDYYTRLKAMEGGGIKKAQESALGRDDDLYKAGAMTQAKAKEILHHGMIHGAPLTPDQKRFFHAIASGQTPQQ